MKQKNLNLILLVVGLIFLGVVSRLSVHAWNFTAMGGLAVFSGAFFRKKWMAALVVYPALLISDFMIGFHAQMPGVYLAFGMMVLAGAFLGVKPSRPMYVGATLAGSFLFFAVSNFFVWFSAGLYPMTLSGLIDCYVMAIPFYQNQFVSDLISSVALFEVAKASQKFIATRLDQKVIQTL